MTCSLKSPDRKGMFSIRITNTLATQAKPWRNSADTVWKCCRLVLYKLKCCLPTQNGIIYLEFMSSMFDFCEG